VSKASASKRKSERVPRHITQVCGGSGETAAAAACRRLKGAEQDRARNLRRNGCVRVCTGWGKGDVLGGHGGGVADQCTVDRPFDLEGRQEREMGWESMVASREHEAAREQEEDGVGNGRARRGGGGETGQSRLVERTLLPGQLPQPGCCSPRSLADSVTQ
jgi:hypothetical protein